jgi:transposase
MLDVNGDIMERGKVGMTRQALKLKFGVMPPALIGMECGTHSRWVSALLREWGHEVVVGNTRKLRMIFADENKSDSVDAETLARVVRLDRSLMREIHHRGAPSQRAMAVLKARYLLVKQRTQIVTHIRQTVKAFGYQLASGDAEYFWKKAPEQMPEELRPAMAPLFIVLERLHDQIRAYDKQLERLARDAFPVTEHLRQVTGVGPITAMAFVLVIDDPHRFSASRKVGSYLGLRPRSDQSGETDRQLPITKCGNELLRSYLVNAAQYILNRGPDSDLRRFGLRIAERGGKNARKRAVIAVARKLSVLLHRLWITGQVYEPLWDAHRKAEAKCA